MRIVLAALCLAVAATVFAAPVAAEIAWSPYQYELASGQVIDAELGTLSVPAHRDHSSGAITLRFVRLRATAPRTGPPILYLAGGPGSSGIESGRGSRWALFEALRQEGDVILLDQRGAGMSDPPPACSTPWTFPADQASSEATFNASLERAARVCAAEWRAAGVDIAAYNTAENAADVANLARALGGRVRLVAISYGTFLAFAVLRDHADLVERVVLAGTEGPDDTVKLPTQADNVLARLSARVARDPSASRLTPNLRRSVTAVFAHLAAHPERVSIGDQSLVISLYDAQMVTAFLLATSENAVRLPALFAATEAGNYSHLGRVVLSLRRFLAPLPAMPLATDAASPVSESRRNRAVQLARRSLFDNAVNAPSADFADALGVPILPERWRAPLHTSTPALFISGDLDSRTPPENAEHERRGFTTSAHLILRGAGHDNDLFLSSPLILERIRAFLRGERVRDESIAVDLLHFGDN